MSSIAIWPWLGLLTSLWWIKPHAWPSPVSVESDGTYSDRTGWFYREKAGKYVGTELQSATWFKCLDSACFLSSSWTLVSLNLFTFLNLVSRQLNTASWSSPPTWLSAISVLQMCMLGSLALCFLFLSHSSVRWRIKGKGRGLLTVSTAWL